MPAFQKGTLTYSLNATDISSSKPGSITTKFRAIVVFFGIATHFAALNSSWAVTQDSDGIIYHTTSQKVMRGAPPPAAIRVNVGNYHQPRNRRWFHLHAAELFPTQRISRGATPVVELQRCIRNDINEISVPANKTDGVVTLLQFLNATNTDAFLVLHEGRIVTEQYFAGMVPSSRHYLWSASKSISVGVLANLMSEHKLSFDAPISRLVPELKDTAYRLATLRDLMDMRSGVNYTLGDLSGGWGNPAMRKAISDVSRNHRAQGYFLRTDGEASFDGAYQFMLTLKQTDPMRPRGADMFYKDPDAFALAWASQKLTNKRFADLLSDYIWSKLGAEFDARIQCDPSGAAIPASGISATLRDFRRWGQMHLQMGRWAGSQVVPKSFIDDVVSAQVDPSHITASSHIPLAALPPRAAYRSQFWRFPADSKRIFVASGMFGQQAHCDYRAAKRDPVVNHEVDEP